MNPHLFTTFLIMTTLLIVAPGPIVTLLISVGVTRGSRAALATVVGTTLGNILLLSAIALGLAWVVEHTALIFEALRWVGAAYLVWLGIQAWRHAGGPSERLAEPHRAYVARGFMIAITNPKAILFQTAFLPQFIDPSLPPGRQLAVMCAAALLIGALSDSAWALAAGLGQRWFATPVRTRLLGRLSALVLIGGGIWLSLARRANQIG